MFCSRCKRDSHWKSDCRAKTFKGGRTPIGSSSRSNASNSYGKKKPSYQKRNYKKSRY